MAQSPSPLLEKGVETSPSSVSCPLCQASRHRIECFARDEILDEGDCIHRYVQCLSCETVYLNPLPSVADPSEIYSSAYPAWSRNRLQLFFRYFLINLPQRRVVERFKRGGSLLDVGCGMGSFLACMQKKGGWRVEGIEPSPHGCVLAHKTYGLSLWKGTLQDAPFEEGSFDVITLWDVLEHVEHPRSTLRAVHRLLKEDGMLFMSMPNIGSIEYPLFKKRWYFLTAPYHFCLFPAQSVAPLFREEGFRILELRTTLSSLYESVFCSLQLVLRKGEEVPRTPFQKIQKKVLSLLGFPLGMILCVIGTPFFLIAHRFKRGSRMIVAAGKS